MMDGLLIGDAVWWHSHENDDNAVPYQEGPWMNFSAASGHFQQKLPFGLVNDVGEDKNIRRSARANIHWIEKDSTFFPSPMDESSIGVEGFWSPTSETVVKTMNNLHCVPAFTPLASPDTYMCCISDSDLFGFEDAKLGNNDALDESELCTFSAGDISPLFPNFDSLGNEFADGGFSSTCNYQSAIENIDVDGMFRNYDSTMEQVSMEAAHKILLCTSSVDCNLDSKVTSTSGLQSSSSKSNSANTRANEDQLVPLGGKLVPFSSDDFCKKSSQEVENHVEDSKRSRDPADVLLWRKEETSLLPQSEGEVNMQGGFASCVLKNSIQEICNTEPVSNMGLFCAKDATIYSKNPNMQTNCRNVASDDNKLSCDRPTIGMSEHLDGIFRSGSIFDQGSAPAADGLSSFSSSCNVITSSNNDSESKGQAAKQEVSMRLKDLESQLFPESESNERPSECIVTNALCDHNLVQEFADQKLVSSDLSTQQPNLSGNSSEQMHVLPTEYSSNFHSLNHSHAPTKYRLPLYRLASVQTCSSIECKREMAPSSAEVLPHTTTCSFQSKERLLDPSFYLQALTAEEHMDKQSLGNQVYDHVMAADACVPHMVQPGSEDSHVHIYNGLPTFMNTSMVSEYSSKACALPDDNSLKLANFQQLQDVMDQLNYRAKQCIRDGLYRMAKNARRRHCAGGTYGAGVEDTDATGSHDAKKSSDTMEIESDTNLIDRYIALLLFHKPLKPALSVVCDARNAPVRDQAMMPDELFHQRVIGECSNMMV